LTTMLKVLLIEDEEEVIEVPEARSGREPY
jgi:hypothetical protein